MKIDWTFWKAAVRDAALIFLSIVVAGFIFAGFGMRLTGNIYTFAPFVVAILGFTVSGCLTTHERLKYLPIVAVFLWVFTLVAVPLGLETLGQWALGLVGSFVLMVIGGALSYVFVRGHPSTR